MSPKIDGEDAADIATARKALAEIAANPDKPGKRLADYKQPTPVTAGEVIATLDALIQGAGETGEALYAGRTGVQIVGTRHNKLGDLILELSSGQNVHLIPLLSEPRPRKGLGWLWRRRGWRP